MAIELLNLAIQFNQNIKGISVGGKEIKITLYADDTTLLLRDLQSVQQSLNMFERFRSVSGLEINQAKTEALWLGQWRSRSDTPFGFRWPAETVYALGIHFSYNQNLCDFRNFELKLKELERSLNCWRRRKLTLLGKINIVKSLGLSKLIFNASVLPLPAEFARKVDNVTFNFLWEGKPHKIKKSTLIGDRSKGGLKMIEFTSMNKALKTGWANRFQDTRSRDAPWKIIPNYLTSHLGGMNFLLKCNYKTEELNLNDLPDFYKNMLSCWEEIKVKTNAKENVNVKEEIIWNNSEIKIDGKSVFFRTWYNKYIIKIGDLLNINDKPLTWHQFTEHFNLKSHFTTFFGLMKALTKRLKQSDIKTGTEAAINLNLSNASLLKVIADSRFIPPITQKHLLQQGINEKDLLNLYLCPFKLTRESKLSMFQFKINHNIVFTKDRLKKASSDLCYLCLKDIHTLHHMLVLCPNTEMFWGQFKNWWYKLTNQQVFLSSRDIIYGIYNQYKTQRPIYKPFLSCCKIFHI